MGQVPEHWHLKRGKWVFRHAKVPNADGAVTNVLSLTLRGVVNNNPDEQSAIVRFLAALDRRVNRFVRAKRRLIELMSEQKQAIITHAVTRGLNPKAKVKSSGIDWLGDVAAHWEIVDLRKIVTPGRRI